MTQVARQRRSIPSVLALALVVLALSAVKPPTALAATSSPIVTENQQSGTSAWQLGSKVSNDTKKQIEGFASATSVNSGGSITFYVTENPAGTYRMDFYRVGYYQGLGGRLMQSVTALTGVSQPACPMDATTGMIACTNWSPSYTLAVPTTWLSGVFLVKLTADSGYQSYIVFTVRDDSRTSALLYQQSVTTGEAYNNWPDDAASGSSTPATGKSLYEYNSSATTTGLGTTRAVKVSFDRPYDDSNSGASNFMEWEIYFIRWMEQNGYDVTYSTDVDTDLTGGRLLAHTGFLAVGHDEYWSKAMYDAAANARDHGVDLGFFDGNSVYWQIRFEPSTIGADRTIVSYKDATLDPIKDNTSTVKWRDPQVNRPEQLLMGAMFTSMQPDGVATAPLVVKNTNHWVYAGTGLQDGDSIPNVVGYEADRYISSYPSPTTAAGSYTALSSSPFVTSNNTNDYQQSMIYQAPSGAWVFDAASIEWANALYNDPFGGTTVADPRIQQMTANILDRFSAGSTPLPQGAGSVTASPVSSSEIDLTWSNGTDGASWILDRSTTPTFDAVSSVTLAPTATSYNDTGLSAGVYYYRLHATGANGNSPYANANAATTSYIALEDSRANLVAHWRLGEASGTTAWDDTGTYNGNYTSTTLGAPGAITNDSDTAATFNGSTSKMTPAALPGSVGDFAVEGWSYLTNSTSANYTLFGGNSSVRILVRPGGTYSSTTVYAGVWLNGTEYVLQPGGPSNVNQWVHWVLTRESGVLTVYRNGVILATRADLPSGTASLAGAVGVQNNGNYPMTGNIDEVSLNSGVLSAGAVSNDNVAASNGLRPPQVSYNPYRSTVLGEQKLVSYWRLSEASGTTAADSKGTNTGTYTGTTLGTRGALANDTNTAATFNGSTSKVTLPSLGTMTDFTVEGWTNLTNGSINNNTLYGGANGTLRLMIRPGNTTYPTAAYAGVWLNGTEYTLQPTSPGSNLNTWVYWVMTRAGNTLTLYRNGVLIAQRTDLPATATATMSGTIGVQGTNYYLAGSADEVAVYNGALSPAAVTTHYKSALFG
jgi:hypothetical protein